MIVNNVKAIEASLLFNERNFVMKKQTRTSILLALALLSSLPVPGWAASLPLEPGDYTSGETLSVPGGQSVITERGTYTIKNADRTLHVKNESPTLKLLTVSGGNDVVINGSIAVSGKNLLNGGKAVDNGSVTVNGNFTYDVDNQGVTAGSGNLFSIGSVPGTADTAFTVTGDLTMKNTMDKATGSMSLMTAFGKNTNVTVGGNLYLYNRMTEEVTGETSGANVLYANNGARITVNGERTGLYAIASNPDAITAKGESTITLNSTQNKVVGNLSFIDATGGLGLANGGTVKAVFDGPESCWWGDEQNYIPIWRDRWGGLTHLTQLGTLDFTFKNGAEWFYFGDDCYYVKRVSFLGLQKLPVARAKYLSAITLEDGGIVNLQDADIQQKLASVEGLTDVYPKLKEIQHDFVTIGDLKGTNGIFKLDLNVQDKAKSDMIYVENATNPGTHHLQAPLTEEELTGLSQTNTLRFATTAKAASGVSFVYDMPVYDDSLYDYTALVGTSPYKADDAENAIYNSKVGGSGNPGDTNATTGVSRFFETSQDALDTTFESGTNWFLYGATPRVKPVVTRLAKTAVGAYDFSLDMDRLNKRQGRAQYLDSGKNGLWVRLERSNTERDQLVDGTATMGQIGYDRLLDSGRHRLGLAYDYKKGSYTLDGKGGSGENRRREVLLYDTIRLDDAGSYLDLVARYGRLNHDFKAYRDDGRHLSGEYDTHMAAFSAEYGHPFAWGKGLFFEPQVQMQYARLGSADYRTENGYRGQLNGTHSLTGRLGFRLGQENAFRQVYVKADVFHEWSGGQEGSLTDRLQHRIRYDVDSRGTWYDVGVGTVCQLSDHTLLSLDAEKTFGPDVRGWAFNASLQWNF
jgi:outer membrane autotransporter protein